MLRACHWFHVLLARSTLWYWACVQPTPLPRLCLNTFPSHTLPGNGEGQLQQLLLAGSQEAGRGLQQLPLPGHPSMGCVLLPLVIVRLHNLPLLQRSLPCHLLHNQNCTNNHSIFPSPAGITGFAWKLPAESPWHVLRQEMSLPQRRRISPGLF